MKVPMAVVRSLTKAEGTAADGLAGDDAEEDLHHVQPGHPVGMKFRVTRWSSSVMIVSSPPIRNSELRLSIMPAPLSPAVWSRVRGVLISHLLAEASVRVSA